MTAEKPRTCGGERPCKHFIRYSMEYDGAQCALAEPKIAGHTSMGHPFYSCESIRRAHSCAHHEDRELSRPIRAIVGYHWEGFGSHLPPIVWPPPTTTQHWFHRLFGNI